MTKPFHKSELLARVQNHLELKEAILGLKEAERADMELQTAQTLQELLLPKNDLQLKEIEPCYLWRASQFTRIVRGVEKKQSLKTLGQLSPRLGSALDNSYEIETQELQVDDVLVWITDGLIENCNEKGEAYGKRRLKKILKNCAGLTAEEIKNRIVESALQHYGKAPFEDDVTLIVGRIR